VDWFPWGDEAIQKAREENKPILVSIGYSACHWCHVMEKESFEDPETADLMNRLFVNIKIDREERPDLDQIYMDAVQAIAGNGGWPLNVFLTPECKPFYGGTYFPPVSVQNRPSWKSLLLSISKAFLEKRKEIDEQADHLTRHIAVSGFGTMLPVDSPGLFNTLDINEVYEQLKKTADRVDGGFGPAPKFPQTFSIRFLLQHYFYTDSMEALAHACLSLDKMIHGGIYDQLGGGLARYSTDSEWLVPHFEKMLYDNSLLITALSEAYQLTGKSRYSRAIRESMGFIQNELMAPKGGFFASLDADSEGEEGKYYIWQKSEILAVLGEEAVEFCSFYDVTEEGNWEGKNILRVLDPERSIPPEKELRWKKKLLEVRNRRVRPRLDDKILLGWNALMITACCKAFAALGVEEYRNLAVQSLTFLEATMKGEGIFYYYHNYKDGRATIPAFLDDYAYLIEAYIQLQEITGKTIYLDRARELTDWVIGHFSEEDTGYFYYTHAQQDDLIVRKREVYDGATPSGNSVMTANLLYLGTVFDQALWKDRASRNVLGLKDLLKRYPGSFGVWATLLNAFTYKMYEVALVGESPEVKKVEFLAKGLPNRVFQCSSVALSDFPLLRNKPDRDPSQFFLCRDYSCQKPVKEVAELFRLIKNS
jgi:uncharacterized protein YyaL (SSP411 family)